MEHFLSIGADIPSLIPAYIIVFIFLTVLISILTLLFVGGSR